MPTPAVPPPPAPPPPPLAAPDICSAAEQRFASIRYVVIDEAVPRELHSLIHSFISQHKLSPSPHLCGYSLLIVSHTATEEQLLALHRRIASLAAVTLLPSSLFLSTPSVPSSPPAASPPSRPAILSFLSLFSRWRVSCTALLPDEKALLAHLTTSLSGHYGKVFDASYTHLVTSSSRSDKYAACQKMGEACIAVHPAYLVRCYQSASLHSPTVKECQRLFTGLQVCVTGIEAQERNTMMRTIQAEGGEYSANLTRTCTHLIAQQADGKKYEAAKLWGLHIVDKSWLFACVNERRLAEESDWPVGKTMQNGTGDEERKEAVETDGDGGESKQPLLDGDGRMNGHRRSDDRGEEGEDEQRQERVQQEEKRREGDEQKEDRKRATNQSAHQGGADAAGWKKKPKKAGREQKAEEDDSLKTVPLPERSQSPRPHSPNALAATAPGMLSPVSSHLVSAPASSAPAAGDDSYLDTVQVLLCLPHSSPLFLRSVALIRAGGGTRLSSYRSTVTHIVSLDVAYVQSTLRSDRLSLLPPNALSASTPAEFAAALSTPIVSPSWLESCHTLRRLVPGSLLEVAADEDVAPPAASRPSSIARQKVVNEFSAFNDGIAREKREVASSAIAVQRRRRRTRSSASGVFAGKLFAFETLELREQEELLLSIRNEGGDGLAADETEDDVHIVVAKHWTADLPDKYTHATFVTPAFISDCLTTHSLLQPNASLNHQPLPHHSIPLPSFASYLFALTGFSRAEQEQLKLLLQFLGAKGVTDGMNITRNTHLVCKEGCAAGKKWSLAWGGSWKGSVVRLQWLVECVRQGEEVPLTGDLVWRKEEGSVERPDNQSKAAMTDVEQEGTDEQEAGVGKRVIVADTHGDASANPTADVEMREEAQQPRPHRSELLNGKGTDEDDVDRTEQDSTAEHMDIEQINPTAALHLDAPKPTHDTADEQTDILAPLPPPSPTSSDSSPFPTRYGRQHGQRTNRIYTPPKTPTSASTPTTNDKGRDDSSRGGRRRRLAVEDRGTTQQPVDENDPFGFQGSEEGKEDKTKKTKEGTGKEKATAAAAVKEKSEVHRKRIHEAAAAAAEAVEQQEEEEEEEVSERQERSEQRKETKEGQAAASEVHRSVETEVTRSRLPGRKRLNTQKQKEEEEEEEEEAEYVPPATEAAEQEEAEQTATEPSTSGRKRSSRDTAKTQKAASVKQKKAAEERKPVSSRKGRTSPEQNVSPSPEPREERKVEQEEKTSPSSSDSRPSSGSRKSARAQRKEQLKAQDAVSPVKARASRRAAAQQHDDTTPASSSNHPIRSTRKRSAPSTDDSTSGHSSDSSSTSASKRLKASTTTAAAAVAAAGDESNKYRFAIATKVMSVDKAHSLRQMIEQLGAECIGEADDYSLCSAVVIKDNSQLKRTEKVLAAVVAGLPILPRSYIEDSSKHGAFLSLYSYRLKMKDAVDDTGETLMRAATRWERKRPFKGWRVWIADGKQQRMLTNVLSMGEGQTETRDVTACTHCLVSVEEAGVEAVMRRMWNAGVPVYRSAMVVEYICYGDRKEWDMDDFKLSKDSWKTAWSNPWKGEVAGSQSTHGTEGVETDGRRKRRS